MTNGGHEFSAKTVDEAIETALAQLGVTEDQVDIEVLNKGSRGILGFGSEPALVRVSLKDAQPAGSAESEADPNASSPVTTLPAEQESHAREAVPAADTTAEDLGQNDGKATVASPDVSADTKDEEDAATSSDDEWPDLASDMLAKLVELMGFEATIQSSWQEPDEEDSHPYLLLDIQGDDLGALIGRRGETLASLQYLLRLMVNQHVRQWKNIVVDVEQYKRRRVTQLTQLAERMAQQVADTGRSVTLEPMPANERRIVHLALRDHPQVFTESIGEDDRRKVSIMPRR